MKKDLPKDLKKDLDYLKERKKKLSTLYFKIRSELERGQLDDLESRKLVVATIPFIKKKMKILKDQITGLEGEIERTEFEVLDDLDDSFIDNL